MTPLIVIPKEDPDILCDCGRPALFLTVGGQDEHGDPVARGICGECLPGDDAANGKPLPIVAFAGAVGRG